MAKGKETYRLIAEVDLKCKSAKFYYGGKHLASCYPENKRSSMMCNVYRYISGDIKSFNNHHYFFIDFEGIPFTSDNMSKFEAHALGVARAQLKEKFANKKIIV